MHIFLTKPIVAGVLIGFSDYLSRIPTVKIYQLCGGELEKREFNPETDSWAVTDALINLVIKSYQAYLYARYVGIFSKDPEMVEKIQKKIEIIDQRLHNFSENDLEENELIEEQETSLSDSLVSDITISTAEELIFRGALQPLLAKILAVSLPALGKKAFMTIALPNLVSTLAIGILFGACHYQDYTKGGIIAATSTAIAGCLFGITKERYGLMSAMIAHSTSNMLGTFVEYYRPSCLLPPLEKTEEIETK